MCTQKVPFHAVHALLRKSCHPVHLKQAVACHLRASLTTHGKLVPMGAAVLVKQDHMLRCTVQIELC